VAKFLFHNLLMYLSTSLNQIVVLLLFHKLFNILILYLWPCTLTITYILIDYCF